MDLSGQHITLELKIVDIDEQLAEFELEKKEVETGKERWSRVPEEQVIPELFLQIDRQVDKNTGEQNISIRKGYNILDSDFDIQRKFLALLSDIEEQYVMEKDGFEAVREESEPIEDIKDPYDPKKIRVDPKNFSIKEVKQKIDEKQIDLSPDFQRGFVWTDITRKSRLVESVLLRIPLPVFYVSENEDGSYQVVDGVQRLTVLKSFLNNEFKLKNLEYLEECEGKYYDTKGSSKKESLPVLYKRRIDDTMLLFNVIDSQTPPQVKFDIFRRINTGGKALNRQEIRNCFATAETRTLIRKLAKDEKFLEATRGSISSTRMADQDIILRFIAFYMQDHDYKDQKSYRGGMDNYLDNTVNLLNGMTQDELNEIGAAFLLAMENAYNVFGDRAFRKTKFINKALFLGVSRVFCDHRFEKGKICVEIQKTVNTLLESNAEFTKALSLGTNDAKNIEYVYKTIKNIIREVEA